MKLPPTIHQAEEAGLCATCLAYHPDRLPLLGKSCFSTSLSTAEGLCSKKYASTLIQQNPHLKKGR